MSARAFIALMIVAVAASVGAGLLVERHTAPGLERTLAFAIIVAGVVFPVGWWMERRGWIRGGVDLTKLGARRKPASPRAQRDEPADPAKGTQ